MLIKWIVRAVLSPCHDFLCEACNISGPLTTILISPSNFTGPILLVIFDIAFLFRSLLLKNENQIRYTHFFARQEILGGSCAAVDDDGIREDECFYFLDVSCHLHQLVGFNVSTKF